MFNTSEWGILDFSASVTPLIVMQSVIVFIKFLNCVNLIKELCKFPFLWLWQKLGEEFSNLIFQICLYITWFRLKRYLHSKEHRNWAGDVDGDGHMNFGAVFRPLYVFLSLYAIKLVLFKQDYTFAKFFSAANFVAFVRMGDTHFDVPKANNVPIYCLAIPIMFILMSQALTDFWEYKFQKDPYKRIFYCLNHPLKRFWVYGNLFSSLVYSLCLFQWLYLVQCNKHDTFGRI